MSPQVYHLVKRSGIKFNSGRDTSKKNNSLPEFNLIPDRQGDKPGATRSELMESPADALGKDAERGAIVLRPPANEFMKFAK